MKPMMRNVGQRFRISDDVLITILSTNDEYGEVSFGIQAPKAIKIHKAERYYLEKVAENDRRYEKERRILLQTIEILEEKIGSLQALNHEPYPTDIKIKRKKFSLSSTAQVSPPNVQAQLPAGKGENNHINSTKEEYV